MTAWRRVDRNHLDQFHWSVDEVTGAADMNANGDFPRADDNVDGFMLLSLVTSAFFNNYPIGAPGVVAWNYGLDRVRFPETVYLEDRIRLRVALERSADRPRGWLLTHRLTLDLERTDRPAMSALWSVMLTRDRAAD